jgi:ADP-ribose pyrophosphatase YjhB (NUDIX family)
MRVTCVAVIVEDPASRVLLLLRDADPALEFPNHWTLPGGLANAHEAAASAAQRELSEETGLGLPISFWKNYDRPHQSNEFVIDQQVFTAAFTHRTGEVVLAEGQEARFFSRRELAHLSIAYGFDQLLEEYFDSKD